jgi:6-phosphogluconolactonase
MESRNFKSNSVLIKGTADFIIESIKSVLKHQSEAHLAVSGGSTPLALFEYLSQNCIDTLNWKDVHFWWVDERFVPHEDDENNFYNAMKMDLNKLPVHFHRIKTENLSISQAVQMYENELQEYIPNKNFDLILLGAGTDGHTASLFKADMYLKVQKDDVVQTINPHNHQKRISLNFNRLINAEQTILLLSGENKKPIFTQLNENTDMPVNWVMQNSKNAFIFTDFNYS